MINILLVIKGDRGSLTIELVHFIQEHLKIVIGRTRVVIGLPVSKILKHDHIALIDIVYELNDLFVLWFIKVSQRSLVGVKAGEHKLKANESGLVTQLYHHYKSLSLMHFNLRFPLIVINFLATNEFTSSVAKWD